MALLLVAALVGSVVTVSPSAGSRHDRFAVAITTGHATGVFGGCRGRFRGTVTYTEAFACPPAGRCRPPRGFPTRKVVVGRFSFLALR